MNLGTFERAVLAALVRLGPNAYGVTVCDELEARLGRSVSVGAVYTTLDRMERKGMVTSWKGDPTPERGGRAKRFFRLTATGEQALRQEAEAASRLWDGLLPKGATT